MKKSEVVIAAYGYFQPLRSCLIINPAPVFTLALRSLLSGPQQRCYAVGPGAYKPTMSS